MLTSRVPLGCQHGRYGPAINGSGSFGDQRWINPVRTSRPVNGNVDLKAKSDEEEARECQKDFVEVTCESSNCP